MSDWWAAEAYSLEDEDCATTYSELARHCITKLGGYGHRVAVRITDRLDDIRHVRPTLERAILNDRVDDVFRRYCEGESLTVPIDSDGNTVLHMAAQCGARQVSRFIMTVHANVEPWKVPNNEGMRPIDVAEDGLLEDMLLMDSPPSRHSNEFDGIRQYNEYLMEKVLSSRSRPPQVLMSLDGGGRKGASHLLVLRELSKHLSSFVPEGSSHPITPLGQADWVAGTSMGAIVGAFFAPKKDAHVVHNIEEEIRTFLSRTDRVFDSKVKYPKEREQIVEELIKDLVGSDTTLDSIRPRFFCTATDGRSVPAQLRLFRNYAIGRDLPYTLAESSSNFGDSRHTLIFEALMASSAAPLLIPTRNYLSDGGVIMKNPTMALLSEFHMAQREQLLANKGPISPLGLVVSLGTGRVTPRKTTGICFGNYRKSRVLFHKQTMRKSRNLIDAVMSQTLNGVGPQIDHATEWSLAIGAPFFRIDPPNVNRIEMTCSNATQLVEFLWGVMAYLRGPVSADLRSLAEYMVELKKHREKLGYE